MIVHEELTQMLGKNYANYFSKKGVIGFGEREIDRGFLLKAIGDFDKRFYVCVGRIRLSMTLADT